MRFQVLKSENYEPNLTFWNIVPCSLVQIGMHFRGAYCLCHHADNEGSTPLWHIDKQQLTYTN